MKRLRVGILFVFVAILLCAISCRQNSFLKLGAPKLMAVPSGFPAINFPKGNEFTKARWELGKKLFFDPILSKDSSISCASCHLTQFAFSDTTAFSVGNGKLRGRGNSPSLANIAYHPNFTRAGGVPTLEQQVLVPIQEHDEFNSNTLVIAEKLKQIPYYAQQAQKAYGRAPDAYVITRALANFERSLLSGNSRFDKYTYQGKKNALNHSERRGKDLFFSKKANCSSCHNGFNFTNYAFENNGLYTSYADSGRLRLTSLETDRARFKVPSLRNIALTAPYMHDGSLKTLEQVLEHYNSGGKVHKNKNSNFVKPLGLNNQEQKDLIAFLKCLTDNEFVKNRNFRNEE